MAAHIRAMRAGATGRSRSRWTMPTMPHIAGTRGSRRIGAIRAWDCRGARARPAGRHRARRAVWRRRSSPAGRSGFPGAGFARKAPGFPRAQVPMTIAAPRPVSRPNPLRNVLSNWGAFTFAAVVNLFLAPFVVRHLGNTAYGVWVLLVALVGYLGYLDLGVRGAVTRYVARFRSAADHAAAGRIASAAFTAFTGAGGVAIVVSSLLAALAVRVFHVPVELHGVARTVLVLGGLNVAASLISGVFGGIVIGLQRFDYGNAVEVVTQGVRAGAIVAALRAGGGLVALAAIQLGVSVLRGAADLWLSRRLYPELRVRWGVWDRGALRLIFGFGITSSLLQVLGGVVLYSDSLVIGAFLSAGLITFFAIAASLTDYARVLVGGVSQTLTPLV